MVTAVSEKNSSASSIGTPLVVRMLGWYHLYLQLLTVSPPLSPPFPSSPFPLPSLPSLPSSPPSPSSPFPSPYQVDYRERYSASNKIPLTFFRRELRATSSEIIVSRCIGKLPSMLFLCQLISDEWYKCLTWSLCDNYVCWLRLVTLILTILS